MARRRVRQSEDQVGTVHHHALTNATPWVFPFHRWRHERARRLLGPDAAGTLQRPTATADAIDLRTRELERAVGAFGVGSAPWTDGFGAPATLDALSRLADVEERHLVLIDDEPGHDALTLAELAVAHRRELARHRGVHRSTLGLALVLLTHQLHGAGRFGDATATGQEAVDVLTNAPPVADVDPRPALVLAHDVSLMTCLATGRRGDATDDLARATHLLDEIARDRPGFDADLTEHRQILAATTADPTAQPPHPARPVEPRGLVHDTTVGHVLRTARTEADALYDDGVRLATSDGDGPAAAAAAGAAVSAYRRLLATQPADRWYATLRRLARALWRHAIVVSELMERPRDALGPGRESLALTRRALRVVESPDDFDELVGELGVRLQDVSHIAWSAGRIGEHDQLTEEVRRLDVDGVGPQAVRAVGSALHDRAAEACETTVALAERGRGMRATVGAGLRNSASAIRVRRSVVSNDPMTRWELANSQLAHGHLRCLDGDGQGGAQAMADAYETVRVLAGPAGQTMRDAAEAALLAACAAFPDVAPRDDWLR